MKRIITLLIIILIFPFLTVSVLAHSGRTDSNGGHYDHSTGEYHYHHGYSAHEHPNGECPYRQNDKKTAYKTETEFMHFLKSLFVGVIGGGIFGGICWSAVMVFYLPFSKNEEKTDKFFKFSAWTIIPIFMIAFFIYNITN